MPEIISVSDVSKTYASGLRALDHVNLEIRPGEIFALLGPNGAGKTTLIGTICGIVKLAEGTVKVGGLDIVADYRSVRALIGLVPQELTTDAFETVWATVSFSRGLFGKPPDPAYIEKTLKDLSLWDKRDSKIMTLSGGMKRRVMMAKALAHEPRVLFLDEPSAGVDVAPRIDMWQMVRELRESGVTIVLTTHYIDEAEDMADRIGVIHHGKIILVEDKVTLMRKLGKKRLTIRIEPALARLPPDLAAHGVALSDDGTELTYVYDPGGSRDAVASLLEDLRGAGIGVKDLETPRARSKRSLSTSSGSDDEHARRSAIYRFEMDRTWRTVTQSIISPVLSTALYFVVFGSAIGSRIERIGDIRYGSFIVPGLIMLSVLTQSIANASFGIYFPKFTGTIYELLSAPVSHVEVVLGYVGAAATKSVLVGLIILATASAFVPLHLAHPVWMLSFLVLTAITFSLFGFIIGIWADGFEKLQLIPMLIVMPLTFLGGPFYSINMLPPVWQKLSLLNPSVYLISGFRWSFFEKAEMPVTISFAMTLTFFLVSLAAATWIVKTGWRLKT